MNNYKSLLTAVQGALKIKGFKKKKNTFYLLIGNNWGLINFQKSNNSSELEIVFTINIGIFSGRLGNVLSDYRIGTVPDIDDCHWKKRIGFMLPRKVDHWWKVDNSTSLDRLINEILNILNTVIIPEIESHIDDQCLEKEWLVGNAEGITELQRYIYLTTLLQFNNKDNKELLSTIVQELKDFSKGKSYEWTALEHIKELNTYG